MNNGSQLVYILLFVFGTLNWSVKGQCPKDQDGFYPDSQQCDKYYECVDGIANELLCQDGLVFNDYSTKYGRCDLPMSVDCSTRPALQPAQPTPHCRRKWGFFISDDPSQCGKFYRCVDGEAFANDCPHGLVFSEQMGTCEWPDEEGGLCSPQAVLGFTCPPPPPRTPGITYYYDTRYPHSQDCRKFYVCLGGKIPRLVGCDDGLVFNAEKSECDVPENVPGCERYYS